jgi:DNA polymerase III delta prime subunit
MKDIVQTHDQSRQLQRQTPPNVSSRPAVSEIMSPHRLSDLTLPAPTIARLQKMVETNSPMNMLFYGKVGTGKTSATRLFADCAEPTLFGRAFSVGEGSEVKAEPTLLCRAFSVWEGSEVKNVESVRTNISRGLSSVGFRIFVLDGADVVPKAAQQVLPSVIDKAMCHCRFLFTVNDRSKIIPEIRSRLMPISFDTERSDREEVQERLIGRYKSKLTEYGIEYDKQRLTEIICNSLPDLRAIAQKVEFEFA